MAYGNVIEYKCIPGHKAADKSQSTNKVICQKKEISGNLYWEGEEKLIECRDLYCTELNIEHSTTRSIEGSDTVGSVLEFECNYGYYIPTLNSTKAISTCKSQDNRENAFWDPVNMICQGNIFARIEYICRDNEKPSNCSCTGPPTSNNGAHQSLHLLGLSSSRQILQKRLG